MTHSFNLIDQPWIPCIAVEGKFVEVSLRGLLARAHKLREVSCETPIMSASVLPLALAILHRVFGPEDFDDWAALWKAGKFDMERLEDYFEKWHERFDLFHPERPFYQVKDNQVDPKSLIYLIHSIGNTATLFTHANQETGIQLSAAEAARQLMAAQYFHTAGLNWVKGKRVPFTDSPFARGVIFWMRGSTLFETLLLNLFQYPDDAIMQNTERDMPCWEMDDPFVLRHEPNGYLDYLTWQSNRIRLIPEAKSKQAAVREMTMIPGLRLGPDVKSPQKRYVQKKKKGEYTGEYSFLYFNTNKAIWRDYDSLLKRNSQAVKPLAAIEWLADLITYEYLEENYPIRLMAAGMLADQAKPIFYRREVMPLPLELLRNAKYAADIEGALGNAEEVAGKLRNALNTLAEHVLQRGAEGKPDPGNRRNLVKQWNALERFWIELEPRFWEFIKVLVKDSDQARGQWQDGLKRIAEQSLAHAISLAGDTPWAWKGGIAAQRRLQAGIKKVLN